MTVTTDVGRLKLAHPDVGQPGGVDLHAAVRTAWTKIGNNLNSRFYTEENLADSSFVDFEHNLKCAFGEIRVLLYQWNPVDDELTRITKTTTPALSDFDIQATPTLETTHIRITNNSGGVEDIAVVLTQGRGAESIDDLDDVDITTASPEEGQALVWQTDKFIPGASGDSSLKLQSIVGTDLNIKSGYLILSDGRELRLPTDLAYDLSGIVSDGDYYVYVDLTLLPASPTDLNGREVYDLASGMFVLSTTTSENSVKSQYAYVGTAQRSGGTWQFPQTGAVRRHNLAEGDIGGDTLSLTASQIDALMPLSHGLSPAVPDITLKVSDGTDYEYHDHGAYFKADSSQIKSTGTTLESVLGASTPCLLTYAAGQAVQFVPNNFWKTRIASSNEPISSNDQVFADTGAATIELTLPATPVLGDIIRVIDYDGSWSLTNRVDLLGNGKTIMGSATYELTIADSSITLIYNGTEWRVL